MPVKESDLEFDAYDCDPERWLEFKQDLFRAASGVIDESGSSLLNTLLDTDMGGAAAGAPALPAGTGADAVKMARLRDGRAKKLWKLITKHLSNKDMLSALAMTAKAQKLVQKLTSALSII